MGLVIKMVIIELQSLIPTLIMTTEALRTNVATLRVEVITHDTSAGTTDYGKVERLGKVVARRLW